MNGTAQPTDNQADPADANAPQQGTALAGDGAAVTLELEQPEPGAVLYEGESLLGFGWMLTTAPVRSMSVALDGRHLCDAITGLARTDVAERHPDHPGSAAAGFTFITKLPPHPAGPATLRLSVRTEAGELLHDLPVEIAEVASTAQLPPPAPALAGELPPDMPPLRLELEEARIDAAGSLYVRGWALAARELRSVEVFFGERSLGFADTDGARADVAEAFPAYPGAPRAGFALQVPLSPGQIAADSVVAVVTDATGDALSASRGVTTASAGATTQAAAPMLVMLEEARINELGVLRVRGWAASLAPIEQVRVLLDDELVGVATHNLPREDVGQAHPAYPNAPLAGFLLQLDVQDERLVGQTLRVAAVALGGISREATAAVTAAPVIRRRGRDVAEVHFHCDAISLTEDGTLYLKGWAVCPSGTEAIEVELDEEALGTAELGLERADVGNHFPQLPGARSAGFRFLGRAAGPGAGEHAARVTVRGRGGESRIALLPVLAQPGEAAAPAPATLPAATTDAGIRFFLDTPLVQGGRATEIVRGFLSINGWAFSTAGISSIEVFVDGRSQGQAHRGIRREDLHKHFGRKEALRSGFAMLVPPQTLRQGRHEMRLVIRDGAGLVEEVAFSVEAEPSMEGPGPWSLRQKITWAEVELHRAVLAAVGPAPAWTLLLPPGGTAQTKRLRATLASLRTQIHPDWTVLLPVADDAERAALLAALAEEAAEYGAQLRVAVADADTKLAELAAEAEGPRLLALLAPGDLLGEDALMELSLAATTAEAPDFLYCDERRTDPADGQVRAFFKPDWSPDLMLSTNYIGRLWAATPALLARTGIRLGDLEEHGEYDVVLRLTEQAARIAHVAKLLCARGGRALDTPAEERRALARALERRGVVAEVHPGCVQGTWHVQRRRGAEPLVSIIIPTAAARGLVRTAIASIREHTAYRNIEIVCVDNIRLGDVENAAEWKAWLREHADAVVEIGERFNWSRFNNVGARAARGEVLLFLNDDIEVTEPGWLDALLEHALRPEIGAVGPQLLYPDGKVQHAGMFLSRTVGRHAFRFSPRDEPGPFGLALTQRNVISVTGACLMTRREVFEQLGGFDEDHTVINNDLDFCLRARAAGRVVVYTPYASLVHHEMASRGEIRDSYDTHRFEGSWSGLFLLGDPYFNVNLSVDYDDYVPEEEPVRALHIGHPVILRAQVRRILAMKVDHIGDFISAFPALRRLKQHFPEAELTVLAAEGSLPLASLEPAIDRVLRFDYFHTRSERGRRTVTKKDLQRLLDELAPYRFDLALDLRRQPETRHVLQHTGARWLAGFDTANRTEWLDIAVEWEGDVVRSHKRTHISDALLQLVDAVAAACDTDRHIIRPGMRMRAPLATWPALAGFGAKRATQPVVCVHVGAGSENKQWPLASFAGLIDLLVARHDANVVVIGAPDEQADVAAMLAQVRAQDHVASVVGKVPLDGLPPLLLACDLYVGNDSGPKHMAASLGVPTVGIHAGSVDPVEWGPLGPAAVAVHRAMTCSPCYLAKVSDCHRGLGCLTGIRVGDVYRQCERLLRLPAPRAA